MSNMKELNLRLTLEELQIVFKALGHQPFQEVYEVIGKINEQINAQLAQMPPAEINNDHPSNS